MARQANRPATRTRGRGPGLRGLRFLLGVLLDHQPIGDAPSSVVADRAHRVWVDFISRGDPGWARYDTARRTTGLLSDTVSAADDPARDERVLWEGIR
jgi:carboxylesterase type B